MKMPPKWGARTSMGGIMGGMGGAPRNGGRIGIYEFSSPLINLDRAPKCASYSKLKTNNTISDNKTDKWVYRSELDQKERSLT